MGVLGQNLSLMSFPKPNLHTDPWTTVPHTSHSPKSPVMTEAQAPGTRPWEGSQVLWGCEGKMDLYHQKPTYPLIPETTTV